MVTVWTTFGTFWLLFEPSSGHTGSYTKGGDRLFNVNLCMRGGQRLLLLLWQQRLIPDSALCSALFLDLAEFSAFVKCVDCH